MSIRYKNLDLEKDVNTLKDLMERLHSLKNKNYVFRGQNNSEYGLEPSIERIEVNKSQTKIDLEENMFTLLKRSVHNYFSKDSYPNTEELNLEWLSLIRHYEATSRLLDFSFSPYVAMFFALIDATNKLSCSIFALNVSALNTKSKSILINKSTFPMGTEDWFNDLITSNKNSTPIAIIASRPNKSNKRINIQQGLFLAQTNLHDSFEDVLFKYDQNWLQKHVVKIKIPFELKEEILKELALMNITYETLYPDFQGFFKNLGIQSALYNPKESPELTEL